MDTEDEEAKEPAVQRLAQALGGVIVVQKGKSDVISDGQKGERDSLFFATMPASVTVISLMHASYVINGQNGLTAL